MKVTPFLWFNDNGEEAMNYYVSIFKDAEIIYVNKGPDGKMFTGALRVANQTFNILNGGPQDFHFNNSISFFVDVEGQAEVDELWDKLTVDGGEAGNCGWLTDKYGLAWQIVPKALGECLGNPDPEKAGKAMQAMMQMHKIIVADLEAAVA